MKKILLLSALFGGFVLNNGYCYDEEHKITINTINNSYSESGLKSFAKDLLNSTIDGKRVVDLLHQKNIDAWNLKEICDDSTNRILSVGVSDNDITLSFLYDNENHKEIKIKLDTDKASNNVLATTYDKNNRPVLSVYVTVLPSEGIGQAFGNATTFETNRLQRNQSKKGIRQQKKPSSLRRINDL